MPDKYIEEVLRNELAILEIDKKMIGGKVSLVDVHDFDDGYKGKSLVTNTKHLDEDDNISEIQEEENDDVTHGAMQTVVERNKTGRKQKKTDDDSDVNISQQKTSIQTRKKIKVEDDREISGTDKAKSLVTNTKHLDDGDISEKEEDHYGVTNGSTETGVQTKEISKKPRKADEDSDVIISQQETSLETMRRGRKKIK